MKSVARIVRTEFWTSKMAMDMFSAEDMYFMLYLMTNPHTTQLGIYPINKKYMSIEFKHSIESINSLLDRFENKYKIIKYSNDTNEIAIKNYLENGIVKGGKPVEDCLIKEIGNVKDKSLLEFVYQYLVGKALLNESVINILPLLHYKTDNDNDKDNDNDNERIVNESCHESCEEQNNDKTPNIYKDVVDYLNKKANTKYRHTTPATQRHIKARQNEGFTLQDFYAVIDVKCSQWLKDKNMSKYLRPETLFGTKFESYLNESQLANAKSPVDEKTELERLKETDPVEWEKRRPAF